MKPMYKFIALYLFLIYFQKVAAINPDAAYEKSADSLIKLMTLEEKLGQLNLMTANMAVTGISNNNDFYLMAKQGKVGAILNAYSVDYLTKLQKTAVENTRLHIPLLFGLDVVNGYKTIFPIPLAQACSWDMELIERIERTAALEATAAGINWTYAPMVDISRDPRWGRVSECPGEDTYLATKIAAARVKGFQGNDFKSNTTLLACAKHFAGYGAAMGGRDYNAVDMSQNSLLEWYLPAYKACVDAGVGSVMASFNEIGGMPSTCNKWLLTDILRDKWGFKGFVVSDYTAINELIAHGIAKDSAQAAEISINAGTDMDMISEAYLRHLSQLIKDGKVPESTVNTAVKRILVIKFKLGLFENPYKYLNKDREKNDILRPEYQALARKAVASSCVLLKNENQTLPIGKNITSIAIIGPMAFDNTTVGGSNTAASDPKSTESIITGIKSKLKPETKILLAQGCNLNDFDKSKFNEAIAAAKQADYVILALGENSYMSGESKSRTDISLPGVQLALARQIIALRKPCVVTLFNGRPLAIPELDSIAPAILDVWLGGTQTGLGVADVLFGDYNPSGKLVMSFPMNVGQIPVFYNYKNTGRPVVDPKVHGENLHFLSRYIDSRNAPLYPFGFGLSYTTFSYSNFKMNKNSISSGDQILASVDVTNTGNFDGEEIVQLYIHDLVGELTRPVKELKRFAKVMIPKGATRHIEFSLSLDDLSYYHSDFSHKWDPGDFEIFVGGNSDTVNKLLFSVQ